MKKTIIYIRVSTENQTVRGISLDNQEDRCKSYCLLHQFDNIEVISDKGVSAKNTNREGFQKMLSMIKKNEVGNVVVYSLSRFARSVKDTLSVLEMLNKQKVNFHSLSEAIDSGSAVGRFFLTTLSAISQYERELTSERTSSVLQYKKKQGYRVGSVMFGFDLDIDGKSLIKNQEEQKTIKIIKDYKKKGLSFNEIAKQLIELKRNNKKGKCIWHKTQIIRLYNRDYN